MELNDELLCAYLDDELDPSARAQVAAELATDSGARLRLERLRLADRRLRENLPLRGGDHFEAAMTARIRDRVGPPVARRAAVVSWALAASLAGLFAGYLLPRPGNPAGDIGTLATDLQRLLESVPSGSSRDGNRMLLTFQAGDGRYCRLFQSTATGNAGEGLACRAGAAWQLSAWQAADPAEDAGTYRPAGASGLIDGVMEELGGAPALAPEQEVTVIAAGWKAPRS